MGTRLYVITNTDIELLVVLNAVHPNMVVTQDALDAYRTHEAAQPHLDDFMAQDAAMQVWFDAVFANPAWNAINNLELYGLGRVTVGVADIIALAGHEYYAGVETNPERVKLMLAAQGYAGLDAPHGVSWS
jgi:hypothetical protein